MKPESKFFYRKVTRRFWIDEKIRTLPPEGKLLAIWLLTNHHLNRIGFFYIDPETARSETGLPSEGFDTLWHRVFDTLSWGYFPESQTVLIRGWFKFNEDGSWKTLQGYLKELSELPSNAPFDEFIEEKQFVRPEWRADFEAAVIPYRRGYAIHQTKPDQTKPDQTKKEDSRAALALSLDDGLNSGDVSKTKPGKKKKTSENTPPEEISPEILPRAQRLAAYLVTNFPDAPCQKHKSFEEITAEAADKIKKKLKPGGQLKSIEEMDEILDFLHRPEGPVTSSGFDWRKAFQSVRGLFGLTKKKDKYTSHCVLESAREWKSQRNGRAGANGSGMDKAAAEIDAGFVVV